MVGIQKEKLASKPKFFCIEAGEYATPWLSVPFLIATFSSEYLEESPNSDV